MKKRFLPLLMCCLLSFGIKAQETGFRISKEYIQNNAQRYGFVAKDVANLRLSSSTTLSKAGAEQIYIQQSYNGYPVYGAIANVTIKENEVINLNTARFLTNIESRNIVSTSPNLTFEQTLQKVVAYFNLPLKNETVTGDNLTGLYFSHELPVELVYFAAENNNLHLGWNFTISKAEEGHVEILELIADAKTGEIIFEQNQLLSCTFEGHAGKHETVKPTEESMEISSWVNEQFKSDNILTDGSSYNVFAVPVEAPSFGGRSIVTEPADPDASPFGWHDTNGVPGAEYNYTRGNNVQAINDQTSLGYLWMFGGNPGYSTNGYHVNSISGLNFDHPYDPATLAYANVNAAVTNLFYWNNVMHDFSYAYGFDEASGNFQQNNYGNGGSQNDVVYAFGQTGQRVGSTNNATFYTPNDGNSGAMSMFMWTGGVGNSEILQVNTAGDFQGLYLGNGAHFGAVVPYGDNQITADLAVIENTGEPNEGCSNITNGSQLAGKIVLIRRGNCTFYEKVMNAQNNGALAVIIVNTENVYNLNMVSDNDSQTIPSAIIALNDGNTLISAVQGGATLNASFPSDNYLDGYIDGSLDNGIVAHEYGHGISKRLTGGRFNSCLNNTEQMGEGWSDYFSLVTSMNPGDQGSTGRGIGTYATGQPTNGGGIRPTPYSTNMSINPSTYANVATYGNADSPHRTGYVWASMIWDMTWRLIDEYGFSPDLYHGTAGNNIAIQLVMDGLKLQPCSPGFVDGRDAILEADLINNGGENQCHIWIAFARRGLGYSADQGSPNSRTDGTAAFDMPPTNILDCTELSTENISVEPLVNIYPNPTKGQVYIVTNKNYNDIQVTLSDVTGRTVVNNQLSLEQNKGTLDISGLPNGVYILKMVTQDGQTIKKVIKK